MPTWRADYTAGQAYRLSAQHENVALGELPSRDWLAITGIGHPQGFFDMLTARNIRFTSRVFADHYAFKQEDLPVDGAVLMTEKDAVKCKNFAGPDWWVISLEVSPESGFIDWLGTRF